MALREMLRSNLNGALANGYFEKGEQLCGVSSQEICEDMISYSSDIEAILFDKYKAYGIDVDNPNPDGSDYHICCALEEDFCREMLPLVDEWKREKGLE